MTTIYYTVTNEGSFRALKKVNEHEVYEPLSIMGKMIQRKTLKGLFNKLAKHFEGEFCLKEVKL